MQMAAAHNRFSDLRNNDLIAEMRWIWYFEVEHALGSPKGGAHQALSWELMVA